MDITIAVTGHALFVDDAHELTREEALALIDGAEIHTDLDGYRIVLSIEHDPHAP